MSHSTETDTGWLRNPMYDTPQYVVIGGYSNTGNHTKNPLTAIFLDRIVPRFENPVYVFRYTKDVGMSLWKNLCDKLRQNSSIMVYNDESEIPAMINAGIDKYDAVNYTMHGCNWPDIPGDSTVCRYIDGRIPKRIINALINSNRTLRRDYTSIDDIYDEIAAVFKADVQKEFNEHRNRVAQSKDTIPEYLSCTDCFMQGTIENANSIGNGSAKYPVVYTLIRHIGTAADMMSAIDRIAFIDRTSLLPEIVDAMNKDFEGYDSLLQKCLKAEKFGCDSDFADNHAKKLMNTFLDIIDLESVKDGIRDVHSFNITTTDMDHLHEGLITIATPDGRRNRAPLSENLSPTGGVATRGVTALLSSIVKLPFDRIHAGAFNLKVRKDWISGAEGLERLMAVLSTYFELGGMQVQISVADTKELLDAQIHPENYRDLLVRITGYSAIFVDMCRNAQDEIIRRDEMGYTS